MKMSLLCLFLLASPAFDHVEHLQLAEKAGKPLVCAACHVGDAAANAERPSRDHGPCDGAGCHLDDWYQKSVNVLR